MTNHPTNALPMRRRHFAAWMTGLFAGLGSVEAAEADVLVIAHGSVPALDVPQLARLYTGRAIEVAGVPITVVNASSGSQVRQRFLDRCLQQSEDEYRAYWTVRRHVGKGVPPREFASTAELIDFVQRTPGAVGYISSSELRPGLRVLLKL